MGLSLEFSGEIPLLPNELLHVILSRDYSRPPINCTRLFVELLK